MAVAMATPEIMVNDCSLREVAMMPAAPPKKAMMTSNRVGLVRASNSDWASLSGEMRKYKVEKMRLIPTMMPQLINDLRNRSLSVMPIAKPIPRMGPISGEISMAPMMTAVELTFSPTEAMMMAQAKIQTVGPLKSAAFLTEEIVVSMSVSSCH